MTEPSSVGPKIKSMEPVIGSSLNGMIWNFPQKVQQFVESRISKAMKKKDNNGKISTLTFGDNKYSSTALDIDLDKQLRAWKENPVWVDPPPKIEICFLGGYSNFPLENHCVVKVSVPKGSLCNLNVKVDIGLPPDAIFNIVIDPDNRRVFKNIKEVLSRKVLLDDGQRQVVEVEQAALWRFLWWSGTISVHVLVDQNRIDHSMKFRQVNTGFMKRFEGSWKVDPIFVDEQQCDPFKPTTLKEYMTCTRGKGRIASQVSLDQLIEPAIVPPPPISWYLRGITSKTTEMIINDLVVESSRLRGCSKTDDLEEDSNREKEVKDIKERWALKRKNAKQSRRNF